MGALIVYAAALPFDTMHAISTAVFLVILYGHGCASSRIKKSMRCWAMIYLLQGRDAPSF
ncbi:MAG: hypothetical protein ACLT98_01135 [Eggerthellaceae bacterium]